MKHFILLPLLFSTGLCKGQITRCSADFDSTLLDSKAFAEIMPTFPGGDVGLSTFLNTNLAPYSKGMSNTSVLFVIDTLGQVKNICIGSTTKRQELSETEKKIIDVIKSMPKWTSGFSGDKKVPVNYAIPIKGQY